MPQSAPSQIIESTSAPGVTDDSSTLSVSKGIYWHNATDDTYYVCLDATVGAATWVNLTSLSIGGTIGGNLIITGNLTVTGTTTSVVNTTTTGTVIIDVANADALSVGPNGATNPTLQVDTATTSAATGLAVTGAAAAGGVALTVLSSGTNEDLSVDAKGSGDLILQNTGTGNVGINISSPAEKLHILGANSAIQFSGGGPYSLKSDGALIIDIDSNDNDTSSYFEVQNNGSDSLMRIVDDGNFGINITAPTGQLHIDQSSSSGAKPVLRLDQGDIDDTFVDYIGTSAADGTRSISSDTTEDSAKFGAFRVEINGVVKWVRVYDDHS